MYNRDRNFRSFAPVKVGDEIDVKIEAVGEKGDGIAKIKNFVIFVANTKAGDNVKIRITRVLQKVGFAEVVGEGSAQEPSSEENTDKIETEKTEDSEEPNYEDSEDF